MAARAGQSEVVRYLVQNGAQVEAKAKVRRFILILEEHSEGGNLEKASISDST